jgi:hypothetical protein
MSAARIGALRSISAKTLDNYARIFIKHARARSGTALALTLSRHAFFSLC